MQNSTRPLKEQVSAYYGLAKPRGCSQQSLAIKHHVRHALNLHSPKSCNKDFEGLLQRHTYLPPPHAAQSPNRGTALKVLASKLARQEAAMRCTKLSSAPGEMPFTKHAGLTHLGSPPVPPLGAAKAELETHLCIIALENLISQRLHVRSLGQAVANPWRSQKVQTAASALLT